MVPADLIRAVAHALLDVSVASAVLALFAVALARIPRVDAATRSRFWSAVAIVPLVAFAAALLQPVVPHGPVTVAVPAYAGALLVDPLDAIRQRGMQHSSPAARPLGPARPRCIAAPA